MRGHQKLALLAQDKGGRAARGKTRDAKRTLGALNRMARHSIPPSAPHSDPSYGFESWVRGCHLWTNKNKTRNKQRNKTNKTKKGEIKYGNKYNEDAASV
jgi:hypothetical protein